MSYFKFKKSDHNSEFIIRFILNPLDVNKSILPVKSYVSNGRWTNRYLTLAIIDGRITPFLFTGSIGKFVHRELKDKLKYFSPNSNFALLVKVNSILKYGNELLSYDIKIIRDDKFIIDQNRWSEIQNYINSNKIDLYNTLYDIYQEVRDVEIRFVNDKLGNFILKDYPELLSYNRNKKIDSILD